MKNLSSLLMAAVFMVQPNAAQAETNKCIEIDNQLDRLACYDRQSGRTPKQQRLPTAPLFTKWVVTNETSAMSDRKNVYMHLESNEIVNCGWNRGDKIMLMLRCHENTTALYINTGCHMTSSDYNDYGNIQYRLDTEPARTIHANDSTNSRSLGLWSGGKSIPVIKQMFDKSQMVVRMTPYGQNPFTATFDIRGIEKAIEPLRAACNW